MPNVFDVLRKDHEEVKKALAELERGPTAATGASPEQLQIREKLVEQLIIEESKHEAVEEEYFWPAVRDKLPDGDRLADEATDQEQKAKYVLDELKDLKGDDPKFEQLLGKFIADGREHIVYEEERVWAPLRGVLSAEEADKLGTKLEEGKKLAPTRPHPHTPPKPGILKAAGPAVAAADRVRDAVTGRGD
ncbi:hemerythrin domain-containing protein [Actinoallomurus spadix]|uniref:Hemerythrin domain-containing protein n=1 Tax=Actinoallomurus spadix TaxID=79912 RepID=A0ABN0W787_9ACTN|nr:hemerythrin domain-containing protein [Actinoallomurus spadix]MCO5986341.1 hemerythrin domain-containing protein [Actinoallomurus spadix]